MVIRKCVFLTFGNKDIIFSWVFLVICSEKADFAAKSTQELHRVEVGKSYTDFKHHINQYILFTSQVACIGAVANRLHYVEPVLGDWQSSLTRCGKDEHFLFLDRIILIWPIHTSWRKILHLNVSTASIFRQFATFWWSVIILLKNR